MHIRSVKLHNIRSYTSQTIEFPEGKVLLSGDIGAGKSTILLALEFALFGIRKPNLSGSALLRNGSREGSVELRLTIDGKDVIVKRTLRRAKDDIKQESGYVIIDGVRTDLSAIELKSRILDLLGYPADLLTKHKDLIYRYTVYTPQEEMKAILFEDQEMRLNTLRKVFGIDKYKRIRENAQVYAKELRDRMRELEAKTYDLDAKVQLCAERSASADAAQKKLSEIAPQIEGIHSHVALLEQAIHASEEQLKAASEEQRKLAAVKARLRAKEEARAGLNPLKLEREIEELGKMIIGSPVDVQELKRSKEQTEGSLLKDQRRLATLQESLGGLREKRRSSTEIVTKITKLQKCPLCEQEVSHSHKESIKGREDQLIVSISAEEKAILLEKQSLEIECQMKTETLVKLRRSEKEHLMDDMRRKHLSEKQTNLAALRSQMTLLDADISALTAECQALLAVTRSYQEIEVALRTRRQELLPVVAEEKRLSLERARLDASLASIREQLAATEREIAEKRAMREQLRTIGRVHGWVTEHFQNIVTVIEKHVMNQIHHEFNANFTGWFTALIDDDTLTARLDDEFAPLITQNGYETDLTNLSGGEKTSVALAYRLALNRVINDFISHIKTQDLIILDEPTDGFSDEQLDKVRDVLDQLAMRQTIVVSHESKIESFVDSVIRVAKDSHVSSIS
jgi:DNA repair protein SbcC/Rad50